MPRTAGGTKEKTSVSLTLEAVELIEQLSKRLGVNKSGIIEMAVRRMAEAERVTATAGEGR